MQLEEEVAALKGRIERLEAAVQWLDEEIMLDVPERYLTDAQGNRIGVVLDIETYQRLIQAAEELADIRAYVEAKQAIDAGEEELIPIDQTVAEYEERHAALAEQAR